MPEVLIATILAMLVLQILPYVCLRRYKIHQSPLSDAMGETSYHTQYIG
jgi:hypothetical protein